MSVPLLVTYYREASLGDRHDAPDPWGAEPIDALAEFRRRTALRYDSAALVRLCEMDDAETRRAAVTALGLLGAMNVNAVVAARLHDTDSVTAALAENALWEIWLRGGPQPAVAELRRLVELPDFLEILAGLDGLVAEYPDFAEAWNQRAIMYFRRAEYSRAIDDCRKAIERNAFHFGALAGMGQCYLRIRRPQAALNAFRQAVAINPLMHRLGEMIQELEQSLRGPGDHSPADGS